MVKTNRPRYLFFFFFQSTPLRLFQATYPVVAVVLGSTVYVYAPVDTPQSLLLCSQVWNSSAFSAWSLHVLCAPASPYRPQTRM